MQKYDEVFFKIMVFVGDNFTIIVFKLQNTCPNEHLKFTKTVGYSYILEVF